MNQRIAIDTPNGVIYLGEECESVIPGLPTSRIRPTIFDLRGECVGVAMPNGTMWYATKTLRPIQPKKMRLMTKAEIVQLVLKGAIFYGKSTANGVAFPRITGTENYPLVDDRVITHWSHYTLPNDPTERKLEVEE